MALKKVYDDNLPVAEQVEAEESIAFHLFENFRDGLDEEDATRAGREILFMILETFCPYFFTLEWETDDER